MIKIDYTIRRNENNEYREYSPNDAIKEIPDLALISGPNSSGKSSLLNFVAFSLGADDSVLVSNTLKRKLSTVKTDMDCDHQETKMCLDIGSNTEKYSFIKGFENNNVAIKYNDRPLSRDRLSSKVDIIYDIPEAPTERLKGLTTAIQSNQERYRNRIETIKGKLDEIQRELNDSRNEKEIAELKLKIERDEIKFNENSAKLKRMQQELDVLREYAFWKEIRRACADINNKEKEIEQLSKKCNSCGKKRKKVVGKEKKQIERYIGSIENNIDNSRGIIGEYYLETDGKYDYFVRHNIDDCLLTFEFDGKFEAITKEFVRRLKEEKNKIKDTPEEIETEKLVGEIIRALNSARKNINIPGIDKTVGEILATLNTEQKKFNGSIKKQESLDKGIERLDNILKDIKTLNDELLPIYKTENENSGDDLENEVNSSRLQNKKNEYEKKKEYLTDLKKKANKCGLTTEWQEKEGDSIRTAVEIRQDCNAIRVERYDVLQSKIQDEDHNIAVLMDSQDRSKDLLDRSKFELEEAEKREKHKYAGKETNVNNAIKSCNSVLRKMARYNRYIENIEQKNSLSEDGFAEYNDSVSNYLGRLMGTIKHVNKQYETKSIDVLNEMITTKEGKIIYFSEMGTGQGQSAYLLSQLSNLEKNDKKLVVLFDEIETMDSSSLLPIIYKLRELKKSGKLLAGILVQKGDEGLLVKNLEEIYE